MSSKASRIPSEKDRLRKHFLSIKELEALIRLRDTARPVLPTKFSGGSPAGSTGGTGNFLPTEGGSMIGNIAFDPKFIVVSNGRVDLDPGGNSPENSSYILVTGQTPTDDINFIDGAERNGQYLIYQGANSQVQNLLNANVLIFTNIVGNGSTTVTVTLSDTGTLQDGDTVNIIATDNYDETNVTIANLVVDTSFTYESANGSNTSPDTSGQVQDGNILTADGNTLVLDGTISFDNAPIVTLIFDITVAGFGAWRVVSVSSGTGGGGISFPIRYTVTDVVATTGNISLNLNSTGGHYFEIGPITGNIDIDILNPPASGTAQAFRINITQDGVGGHTVTFNDTLLVQPLINEDVDGVTLLAGDIYDGSVFNIFTMTSTAGSGGGGDVSQWATFPAVSDVNFSTFDGINIDRLLFDQAAGESLASTDIGITSDVSGNFLTNAVGEYRWLVDANLVMALNASQLTMSSNIDMNNKSLFDAITVDFNTSNTFDPTTLTIIGFDSFSSGLKYNSGATTTNHQFEIGGEPMILISRLGSSRGALTTERLIADELIDLTTFTNSSPINGNIWLDLTSGLFQFRQNGVTIGLGGGGGGDVVGPAGATANAIAKYSGTSGKIIQNSAIIINPAGEMSGVARINQDATVPTSGFINMANSAALAWEASPPGADGTISFSSNERFVFSDNVLVGTTNGGASLGVSSVRWGNIFAQFVDISGAGLQVVGNTSLQGNTFLGTGATDEIAVSGRWVSSLIPLTDNLRDLGASGVEWRDLFIDGTADIDRLENNGSNIAIGDDLDFDFGDTIDFNQGQSTVGAAGFADILPNRPNVYLRIKQNGVDLVIPAFAVS